MAVGAEAKDRSAANASVTSALLADSTPKTAAANSSHSSFPLRKDSQTAQQSQTQSPAQVDQPRNSLSEQERSPTTHGMVSAALFTFFASFWSFVLFPSSFLSFFLLRVRRTNDKETTSRTSRGDGTAQVRYKERVRQSRAMARHRWTAFPGQEVSRGGGSEPPTKRVWRAWRGAEELRGADPGCEGRGGGRRSAGARDRRSVDKDAEIRGRGRTNPGWGERQKERTAVSVSFVPPSLLPPCS